MSYKKKSFAERIWAALLSVVLVITMLPVNVAAEEKISGVLSTDISEKVFNVGEAAEFTFTTTANDDAGTMVIGSFEFSNPDAIEKLEYLESKDGQWYEFYGDFGPATGFPMSDATSTFRVTFKEAGNYTVTASMKTVEDSTVLCSTNADILVKGIPSVLTTDIGEKVFQVGEATEFTFTTTANGDAGTMVIGSFEFSDPDSIEKLEYLESQDGQWHEFYGDFGPATGFPMSDATSTFRVTFNKAGNYTVNASMKTVAEGAVLCSAAADVSVEHKVSVNVTANEGGSVSLNGDTSGTLTVDAGSAVLVDIKAEDGYQIAALNVGGAIIANAAGTTEFAVNTVVSRDVQVAVTFVKVWKVTVSYTGEGNVEMSPEGAEGNVIVETGTEVLIQANPKPHYHVEKVFINGVEEEFSSKNDAAYEKTLTADKEYTVEVTFAPNVYEIVIDQAEADKEKGSVSSANAAVEYKGSNRITIEPKDGYTVDTVTVTDAATNEVVTVGAITKESGSVYFDIPEIAANLKVSVTFKAEEVASADDLTITADDLRPLEEQLIVVRNGGNVTFTTEKEGIRIYSDDSILIGDETTQTVYVDDTTAVTKVELYYQADGELYADWHVVGNLQPISIVVDAGNIEASLTPDSEANGNGYYNKDVAFKVYAEDMGDYSGLQSVYYQVTRKADGNDVIVTQGLLYEYKDGDDIINVYSSDEDYDFVIPSLLDQGDGLQLKLLVSDRAGNDYPVETQLHINPVKPTVSMSIDGTQKDNAQVGYYDSDRKLTITITDRADTFSEANATSGLSIEKNGVPVEDVQITWTHNKENGVDTYVSTYTFTEDGHYTWSYSYNNLAGLSNDGVSAPTDKSIFDFGIDRAAPTDLKISYGEKNFVKDFLNKYIFYNPTVTVTIEATDDVAGIDHFAFSYKVDENVSSVNKGETDVILQGAEVKEGENNAYYATYDIPAQFRGKVSFTAVDKSGNISTRYEDGRVVVVDSIAPGVTVNYESVKPQYEQHINQFIKAEIIIKEANFFGAEDMGNQLVITREKVLNDGTSDPDTILRPEFEPTGNEDEYATTIWFDEDADYTFDIAYTDRSGNTSASYEKDVFTIDTIAPIISGEKAEKEFYDAGRIVKFTIVEHNFDPVGFELDVHAYDITGKEVNLSSKDYANYLKDAAKWSKVEGKADTWEAEVPFEIEGRYTIKATHVDKAGNTQELAFEDGFCIDKEAPEGLKVTYNEKNFIKEFLDKLFYNPSVTVTIEATDEYAGVKNFVYSYTVEDGASSINSGLIKQEVPATRDGNTNRFYATFDIPAQFRGNVSFTATDYSENTSTIYEDGRIVVVDNIAPGIRVEYESEEPKEGEYLNHDIKADVYIKEANFFGTEEWGYADLEEHLIITRTKVLNDGTKVTEQLKPEFKATEVEDEYVATILFDEDADYSYSIDYTDAAGNKTKQPYQSATFTIDKTAPIINVEYKTQEEPVDGYYYTKDRTAIVTVVEHNFNPAGFKLEVNAKDVNGNDIDLSSKNYADYLKDATKWTGVGLNTWQAEVPFTIEGHYTVKATCIDMAGNPEEKAFEDEFCLDKTAPVKLTVTYKDFEETDGFYKDSVEVTVEAKENISAVEYFAYSYTVEEGASSVNSGLIVPEVEATQEEGTYRFYTTFIIPAQFRGNVSFTAINMAELSDDYKDERVIVVDNIEPEIYSEHVNGAFYNAERAVTFKVKEANFYAEDFKLEVEAYDVTGKKPVDLSSKDYANYLKDAAKWSKVEGEEDTWQAEVPFDIEGNYEIRATYTDRSGNVQKEVFEDKFCIDTSKPVDLTISYEEENFISELINAILGALPEKYAFYNPSVTVRIEATDEYAGVKYFKYSYAVAENVSSTNSEMLNQEVEAIQIEGTNKFYATFDIPAQFRGNVSFEAYDKATNSDGITDEKVEVVVDTTKPEITVSYDLNNDKDDKYYKYYNVDRTATITIKEANFFGKADYDDGLLVITRKKVFNDGTEVTEELTPEFKATGVEDEYAATVKFDENADYKLTVEYKDRSDNVADTYQSEEFTVDKIAPTISVSYNDEESKFENDNQFRTTRKAAITIVEHNFNAADVDVDVTASGYEKAQYFDYVGHLTNPDNWMPCTCDECKGDKPSHQDMHIAEIPFEVEAHYTFDISYTDMAGKDNIGVDYGNSVAPNEFTVDTTAPTELNIQVVNDSVNESVNDPVENTENGEKDTLVFDKFYSKAVTVKLSANCDISGLDNLRYQKVVEVADYKEDGTWTEYDVENGIEVLPTEKFIIYFRAEDRAGNYTIIRSTGIVVDNKMPIGETRAPEIDIFPDGANTLHASSVDVDLKVVEPAYIGEEVNAEGYYSGIQKVTYRIYASDLNMVEEGVLLEESNNKTEKGKDAEGIVRDKDGLIKSFSTRITVGAQFNSNNVVVEITAVDNAGNERTTSTGVGEIQIDTTAPSIEVSYDNNSADGDVFFSANRVAQITIAERNFNGDDVNVNITNTDGVIPTVSTWYETAGTGNGDDTRWTAIIEYNVDGDYTFEISYTDLAGNAFNSLTYAPDTVAPEVFTIDKTIPVIDVTYNNNQAMNSNYYDAERTATVRVREHNFNAERVEIVMTATNDGKAAATPAVSAWIANGDEYTAVIRYAADALYTFDIAVRDNAGNEAADFVQQSFYIDQTMPLLTITGVKDKSANNGSVVPVVTYSDTNFDPNQVMITLTGANRKQVVLDGTYSNIHNGKVFTFADFANEKEMDDIYTLTATLTDKAGNTSTETILFSVNRFGSTYMIDENVEKLNGTYVQEPQDIIITEVNPNELNNIQITLFKNNETLILKEGTDYKIDIQGKEGEWYRYTYTIFKENFADDGVYRLSLYSEDAAGNVAQNTLDTKNVEINFGVDKTKPNIVVENLESGITYAVEGMTAKLSVSDNLILNSVMVYLDDLKDPYKTWTAEEIAQINANGGEFEFEISGDSTSAHEVKIVSADVAGNEQITEISDFYVTTNLLVRYVNNKPLLYGSIAGMVLAIGVTVLLIINGKEKRK